MPELPEVETVVRALRRRLRGRTLQRPCLWQPVVVESDPGAFSRMTAGARVERVRRRGKWIVFDLNRGYSMLAHLRMTGHFRIVPHGQARERHDHVEWPLDDGDEVLRFNDTRRFGRFLIVATAELEAHLDSRGWGPEPLSVTPGVFHARLGKGKRSIKAALLDQSVVAGIGNIYADEILYAARIDPRTPTSALGPARVQRIHAAMTAILRRAIAAGGTSLSSYVSPEGRPGRFRDQLQVFRRDGEPCPSCGRRVRRVRLAGRATHFCTRCQR